MRLFKRDNAQQYMTNSTRKQRLSFSSLGHDHAKTNTQMPWSSSPFYTWTTIETVSQVPSLQVQNITGIKWIWFYINCCQLQVQLQQYKCYHQSYLKSGDHVYNMIGVPSLRDTFLKNHKQSNTSILLAVSEGSAFLLTPTSRRRVCQRRQHMSFPSFALYHMKLED